MHHKAEKPLLLHECVGTRGHLRTASTVPNTPVALAEHGRYDHLTVLPKFRLSARP